MNGREINSFGVTNLDYTKGVDMKKCLKWGNEFKNRIIVNGSVKVLNKRKYCLECSPFGKRNTQKLHLPQRTIDTKKQCPKCGRSFKWNKNNVCWDVDQHKEENNIDKTH